ncbi:hypothetical protein HMPREF2861_00510 [Lactobacillus sp. HMSC068F07]|nr:hypothetical protein HMPREF2861_00510 [Lactobacillus sp. HMSC068F07]
MDSVLLDEEPDQLLHALSVKANIMIIPIPIIFSLYDFLQMTVVFWTIFQFLALLMQAAK